MTDVGPVGIASAATTAGQPQPVLSLALRGIDPAIVIEVSGDLDITTAWQLTKQVEQILEGRSRARLVLDLSGLRFFSAAGVDALLWIRTAVGAAAGQLVLRDPPTTVCQILWITGTIDAFDIQPDHSCRLAAVLR